MPEELYKDYSPQFTRGMPDNLKGFSLCSTFYNRAEVATDKRVDALIQEGIRCEQANDYPEAVKAYHTIIERYPESLVQVSEAGIFVSAARYAQQRILKFPRKELAHFRLLYDAPAREAYERARAKFSVPGLHDVAVFHMASSYGSKALMDLGCRALDLGQAQEAAGYFETIRQAYPPGDYDAAEVAFRLAYAYKLLGRSAAGLDISSQYPVASSRPNSGSQYPVASSQATPNDPTSSPATGSRLPATAFLEKVRPLESADGPFVVQKRHPRNLSFSDHDVFEPLETPLLSGQAKWMLPLPIAPGLTADDRPSHGEALPFHLPWVVGHDLYFKHYNRIFCCSLVTGQVRWVFDLPPLDRDVRRLQVMEWNSWLMTLWYADQDILVDNALVYANVQVYGRRESLVALDRVTGEVRWTAGPIRPSSDDEMMTRYDGTPALGTMSLVVPWSRDQGEGEDHLYTSVGLSSFDKETGRLLWSREICRLSPTSSTQEKMGIRVFSSPPVVHEGVIYHVTGAGVVTAVDEASGQVRWISRYPHAWHNAKDIDAHDEINYGSQTYAGHGYTGGPRFRNRPPLVKGDVLFVSPFDSDFFLCLDRRSGKVLWNFSPGGTFEGLAPTGELVFATPAGQVGPYPVSGHIDFIDAQSARLAWQFYPSYRSTWDFYMHGVGKYMEMNLLDRPVFTRDGKMYFTALATPFTSSNSGEAHSVNPAYSEWCLSLPERKLVDCRIFFSPKYRDVVEGTLKGNIKDLLDFARFLTCVPPQNVNAETFYEPTKRLPFRHHGVLFELDTNGQSLAMKFDRQALDKSLAGDSGSRPGSGSQYPVASSQGNNSPTSSPATGYGLQATFGSQTAEQVFTQAELLLAAGRQQEAVEAFGKCRAMVKPEERDLLREIDRELFGQYRDLAFKARLAGDKAAFAQRAEQMSQAAITVEQEIQSLLVLAESFEWSGQAESAARCLQSVIKHYPDAIYAVPYVTAIGQAVDRQKDLRELLAGATATAPAGRKPQTDLIAQVLSKSVPAYFSLSAPIKPDVRVEARQLGIQRLRELLAEHTEYQAKFEQAAAQELSGKDPRTAEMLMPAYPGAKAAQAVLDQLTKQAMALAPAERDKQIWQLGDQAAALGLKLPKEAAALAGLAPQQPTSRPAALKPAEQSIAFEDPEQTLRLILRRRDSLASKPELVFLGARSKRRLGSKFALECVDAATGNRLWTAGNLRLKDKADEVGFEEAFVAGDLAVTHGKNDVIAFGLAKGEVRWRMEVPFDFDLRSMDLAGDLLILSGARNTLGVQVATGQVAWSKKELGELYCPPFLREGLLVSVRREPYGVSFRRLGSGQLLRHLDTPDLSLVTKHPVLAEDISRGALQAGATSAGLPVDCQGDLLMLTDGANYLAVDLAKMEFRWKRPIDNNDVGQAPIRFHIREPNLLVLKRDFNVPSLYLLDTRTGEVVWSKKGAEVVHSLTFGPDGKEFFGLTAPSAGRKDVVLKCFDIASGAEKWKWEAGQFDQIPDAAVLGAFPDGRVAVRIITQDFQTQVYDAGRRQLADRLTLKGVGTYGLAGGKFAAVQGDLVLMMDPEQMGLMSIQSGTGVAPTSSASAPARPVTSTPTTTQP